MKFLNLVASRQSVRRYTSDEVEPDKIKRCLEAARLAPSASNSQPWSFILLTDETIKDQVARETFNDVISFNKFVLQAPVLVVMVVEPPKLLTQIGSKVKKKEWPLIDIGIAAEHFCLQATEEELGTCMIGWYNEKKIKKILNIPLGKSIGLIITLGYSPKEYKIRAKSRKEYKQLVYYNGYKKD